MTTKNIAFILIFFILSSCSKNIYVNINPNTSHNNTIVLKPSRSTEKTYITVNGNLIVDKKFVKSVNLNNVPNGTYEIEYKVDNSFLKENLNEKIIIDVNGNELTTKLISVPPYSVGYWIYQGLISAAIVSLPLLTY